MLTLPRLTHQALIPRPAAADITGMSNVDERLLARFEASWEREQARRDVLPAAWRMTARDPADHLGDLFDDVLERARERVRAQRAELEALARGDGLDPAV